MFVAKCQASSNNCHHPFHTWGDIFAPGEISTNTPDERPLIDLALIYSKLHVLRDEAVIATVLSTVLNVLRLKIFIYVLLPNAKRLQNK